LQRTLASRAQQMRKRVSSNAYGVPGQPGITRRSDVWETGAIREASRYNALFNPLQRRRQRKRLQVARVRRARVQLADLALQGRAALQGLV
jgi:hypothetical protein